MPPSFTPDPNAGKQTTMPSSFTPTNSFDQSKQTFAHSNSLFQGAMNLGGQYADVMKNFSTGVAQQELGTLQNVGKTIAQPIANAMGDKGQLGIPQQTLQSQNPAQTAGQITATGAEFLAPGGLEESAVAKGSSYIDKLPDLLGLTGKAASAITGTLKTALQGLTSAGTFGGVTAAQTGDLQQAKSAAELGGVAGAASGVLQTFGPEISQALNKADFKLSPAQEAKTTKIADSAAKFITANKVVGTDATKFSKLTSINNNLESVLQSSLPKDLAVPKQNIIDNINASVESMKESDPAIYNQARNKADEAISVLQSQESADAFTKGGAVSIKNALNGKRSWASMAFKTSKKSKMDPTVSSEGAYAVEQGYQKALEDTLQKTDSTIKIPQAMQKMFGGQSNVSLSDFNKVYSQAINAKNLTGIAQYKNDAGLFGRLFGLWAGKSIGQAIMPGLAGEVIGGGIGEIASTHLPGAVRNVAERTLTHPNLPTGAAKIEQTIQNQNN